MEIALIQKYHKVGDKSANLEAMLSQVESQDAELIVFPELSLTGYNLGDRFDLGIWSIGPVGRDGPPGRVMGEGQCRLAP